MWERLHEHDGVKCLDCTYTASNQTDLIVHMAELHTFTCAECQESFKSKGILISHMQDHMRNNNSQRSSTPVQTYSCNKCEEIFTYSYLLNNHVCSPHAALSCDQCGIKASNFKTLVAHLIEVHSTYNLTFNCNICSYEWHSKDELDDHMGKCHETLITLNGIARNQQFVSDSLDKFRTEVTKTLEKLIEENVAMKQELFILRQTTSKNTTVKEHNVSEPIHKKRVYPVEKSKVAEPTNTNTFKEVAESPEKNNVLFVEDSVSRILEKGVIEKAMKSKIKHVKAYTSQHDDGSKLKISPRFPNKNFKDVIEEETEKEAFDHMVIQSGSADITNLITTGCSSGTVKINMLMREP